MWYWMSYPISILHIYIYDLWLFMNFTWFLLNCLFQKLFSRINQGWLLIRNQPENTTENQPKLRSVSEKGIYISSKGEGCQVAFWSSIEKTLGGYQFWLKNMRCDRVFLLNRGGIWELILKRSSGLAAFGGVVDVSFGESRKMYPSWN